MRSLTIPFEWQDAVIRSAITLKLCSLEQTGAIVAALTTSIPEAARTQRNWDYRYCWPRDAYFTIQALNRVGAHQTVEDYLSYLENIVASADGHVLQPVYGVTLKPTSTRRSSQTSKALRAWGRFAVAINPSRTLSTTSMAK